MRAHEKVGEVHRPPEGVWPATQSRRRGRDEDKRATHLLDSALHWWVGLAGLREYV